MHTFKFLLYNPQSEQLDAIPERLQVKGKQNQVQGWNRMEIQIQDLVQSIKHDGIEEAKKEAAAVVDAAKVQAQEIIEDARKEASRMIDDANREIESAKALVKQAQRDAVLSVKKELEALLDGILSSEVSKTMTGEQLSKVIVAAINGEDPSKYVLEVKDVNDSLKSGLAKELEKGLEIKPVKNASVRLCLKDGSGFYDFSDEEIANLLKPFLGGLKF